MKQSVDQSLRKAASLSAKGHIAEAEAIYRNVLERFPANKRALDGMNSLAKGGDPRAYDQGLEAIFDLYDRGRLREAADHLRLMIDLYPSQPDLHNLAGAIYAGMGQPGSAVEAYDRALALNPNAAEVHANRAGALIGLHRYDEALADCDAAIRIERGNAQAHSNRGIALKQLGRPSEAVAAYDAALRWQPDVAETHYNRANALLQLDRRQEAIDAYDRAIALRPTYVAAYSNRGNALHAMEKFEAAIDSYRRAIALDPNMAEAHSNLGKALLGLDRLDEAHDSCRKAVELQPGSAELHYNLAVALQAFPRHAEALAAYDAAILCDPGYAKAHGNRGHILFEMYRPEEAAESYAKALTLDPQNADGFYALGNILQELGRLDEAVECYLHAIEVNPVHDGAVAQLAYQRARMCDWQSGPRPDLSALVATRAVSPLIFTWLADDPPLHLARATKYSAEKYRSVSAPPPKAVERPSRIRLGYFSAEFHDHAVMFQLARMFELHDRDLFSVHAYSFGPTQASPMRSRLIEAFDVFHDVSAMSNRDAAELARSEGIDIAIDLMGHSGRARTGIFACRAAPVQIHYMGYPGTMGAPFIDYLIADPHLIASEQRQHYAEKIIRLPECYQANDDQRPIASHIPSRRDLGLPGQGFVFCCFNNSYKITADEFDIWMRLLTQVEGSVLWLFEANSSVENNLRSEAARRGVDPGRIVFAGRMQHADHLARLRQADLFLDCFECNAHATASDALWAGVPVLTLAGRGYAARVGASVVHAIGLPELAAASRQDYEDIALALATDLARLADIKRRLTHNRTTMPLFDSERFTRHIEAGFQLAHDRYWDGLAPGDIDVPSLPTAP